MLEGRTRRLSDFFFAFLRLQLLLQLQCGSQRYFEKDEMSLILWSFYVENAFNNKDSNLIEISISKIQSNFCTVIGQRQFASYRVGRNFNIG